MSSLKVIDISSHQSTDVAGMSGIDGVIIKATQGNYYVHKGCDAQYQLAKRNNRLLGVYHYAGGLDPVVEADFFLSNIKNYIKEATLWLDWEANENAAWGNTNWCRAFVNRVHEKTGVWCGIYVQASAINQVANLVNDCPLWVAGYPVNDATWNVPAFPYSIAPWKSYTLWQFSSGGGLDKNVANLTAEGWKKIANPSNETKPPVKPPVKPSVNKSIETLATEVVAGKHGSGEARKKSLGAKYNAVQAVVDQRLKTIGAQEAVSRIKNEVVAGKLGNGDERKFNLGTYYTPVQNLINGGSGAPQRVYTVQSGDSLSSIGAKLGINWTNIAAKNGIKPPYVIYAGQKLQY